jgi:hypothetical protein
MAIWDEFLAGLPLALKPASPYPHKEDAGEFTAGR